MKRIAYIVFPVFLGILFTACNETKSSSQEQVTAKADSSENSLTSIEFDQKSYDFGTVAEGEKVAHTFKFTNTGTNTLVLESVKASCGCTASNFTKDPVAPGSEGSVEVVFNSAGRPGPNHKSLTVVANTDPRTTVLTFNVNVEKKSEE